MATVAFPSMLWRNTILEIAMFAEQYCSDWIYKVKFRFQFILHFICEWVTKWLLLAYFSPDLLSMSLQYCICLTEFKTNLQILIYALLLLVTQFPHHFGLKLWLNARKLDTEDKSITPDPVLNQYLFHRPQNWKLMQTST